MKQITNKEYEEWQKYKAEKEKGTIYVTNAPPLVNNTNSENEFVLFFAVDYFGIVAKRK